jgi:hypothetical protein
MGILAGDLNPNRRSDNHFTDQPTAARRSCQMVFQNNHFNAV